MALGIISGTPILEAKAFTNLKVDLDEEKAARITAQIEVDMRQSVSLTLVILKSLYPRADLDAAGEGFASTCSNEEALKLVKDSAKRASQVVDMLGIDMSLG
jgi:hypothetical protein